MKRTAGKSLRTRRAMEQAIHLIFLLCGIVAVGFVLCISVYLVISGLPAIREIGLTKFLFGKVWAPTNATTGPQFGILPFILTSVYGTAGALLLGVPVGLMTVIVHAQSKVADLTVEQIAKIFTGEITDWSQVGGDPGAISCIGRESGSGTRDGFESITGTKDSCKLDQELTSTGGVIEAVAGNPNAIGYASLSAVEGKDTVKAVTVGGVACTEAAVLDGSYAIQRPFVLVTKDGMALSPAAQAFFDFATSKDAASLIQNAGAVPTAK